MRSGFLDIRFHLALDEFTRVHALTHGEMIILISLVLTRVYIKSVCYDQKVI